MNAPTDYAMLKRVLSNKCADSPDHTQTDANMLISESVDSAYKKLSAEDQENIMSNAAYLRARCPKLSEAGALEILAAVGQLLSETETK